MTASFPRRLVLAGAGAALAVSLVPGAASASRSGNPTGTKAGSLPNGAGYLGLSLTSTADGRLQVRWRAARGAVRRYVVRVGPDRRLDSRVQSYAVSRTRRSIVVPRAFGVGDASGNFSFVKVYVRRTHGGTGSSPTKWIQGPVAGCTSRARARVATFNVRTWRADRHVAPRYRWRHRGPRVVSQILHSGARVVAIQEASGGGRPSSHGRRQDRAILAQLNVRDRGARWVDALPEHAYRSGLVGTRVFYDARRYTALAAGFTRLTVSGNGNSLAPWARLRAVGGGTPFVFVSTHLANGDNGRVYRVRGRQAEALATVARDLRSHYGGQVIVAGDLNSTVNTKPYNNVHQILLGAGFRDAFASPHLSNSRYPTTNDFHFPTRATPHRRDYILSLGSAVGSCGYTNYAYRRASKVASDHFLQAATLPLT